MDAIYMSSSSAEKSFSPYKQFKNNIILRRNGSIGAGFVSKPSENLAHATANIIHGGGGGGGLLFAPPPSLSFSYPPPANIPFYQNHHHLLRQQRPQQQPPLLPLPTPNIKPLHNSLPSRTRSLSSSPRKNKSNRTRDQSFTPKISKSKQLSPGNVVVVGEDPKKVELKPTKTETLVMATNNPLGPDPNDLPKVLTSSYLATGNLAKDLDHKFSGPMFTISPPPSSLPLPKFSLRPKLSCCNAEAAAGGIDAGATDNLRRLLRLR